MLFDFYDSEKTIVLSKVYNFLQSEGVLVGTLSLGFDGLIVFHVYLALSHRLYLL